MKALLLTVCALAILQCGQATETAEVISAVRKVQTGTQVGVTFEQYSTLLIDAKTKRSGVELNESVRLNIDSALDAYVDAGTIWQMQMRREPITLGREPGATILPKYSIQVNSSGIVENHDNALQVIWQSADNRIAKLPK